MAITIHDVARAAGVGIGNVSRASSLSKLIEDPLQPAKLIRLSTKLIERHTTGLAP